MIAKISKKNNKFKIKKYTKNLKPKNLNQKTLKYYFVNIILVLFRVSLII